MNLNLCLNQARIHLSQLTANGRGETLHAGLIKKHERAANLVVTRGVGGTSRSVPVEGSSAHSLLGADGVQLELPLRPSLCH